MQSAANILIGGTDAPRGSIRSSIFPGGKATPSTYDIISYDPYIEHDAELKSLKIAMKARHCEFENIMPRNWEALAASSNLEPAAVLSMIQDFAEMIPDQMATVRDACLDEGLDHPVLQRMVDGLAKRNERALRVYGLSNADRLSACEVRLQRYRGVATSFFGCKLE